MVIILRGTYAVTYRSVRSSPPIATEMTAEEKGLSKNLTNAGVLPVHSGLM